jgi:hypothetical protein
VDDDVDGIDEEESNSSLVTSRARIGSDPGQEVVQDEEATTFCAIPSGWVRVKLEPETASYLLQHNKDRSYYYFIFFGCRLHGMRHVESKFVSF